ncbi:O-acetyl-ADP-ribose deacetylase MACROD1-like, partial [Limulus polyphemus]|uniref:O-acetyl-ADP-ribose deacetylase MACROD1-like n=1 Tax=Limulus polyphemus TaxID=6850 RepID=A0ABM1BZX1_LIMPO
MMPGRTEELSKKEKYLKMRLKEKRAIYRCSKYITLIDIPTWHDYYRVKYLQKNNNDDFGPIQNDLNRKVSLFFGDITSLEVDAIVNSANKNLRGGLGGVCDVILKAANSDLLEECIALGGCNTGDAKITGGYMLPAKYIIHAVGPNIEDSHKLCSSYLKSLDRLLENKLKSIAFPCISTGLN